MPRLLCFFLIVVSMFQCCAPRRTSYIPTLSTEQILQWATPYYPKLDQQQRYCDRDRTYQLHIEWRHIYQLEQNHCMLVVLQHHILDEGPCGAGSADHIDIGHSDVLLVEYHQKTWQLKRYLPRAIPGEGWGSPPFLSSVVQSGDQQISLLATSGFTSQGCTSANDYLIHINADFTTSQTVVPSFGDNIGLVGRQDSSAFCWCTTVTFDRYSNNSPYDLQLKKYSCIEIKGDCAKGLLLESAVVPCKDGRYVLPASFLKE